MKQELVRAYFIFDPQEKKPVEKIVGKLRSHNVSGYWRGSNEVAQQSEDAVLQDAQVVCVFIGAAALKGEELKLVSRGLDLEKPVLSVLIGDPPKGAIEQTFGVYSDRRYVDLRKLSSDGIMRLAEEIRKASRDRPVSDKKSVPASEKPPATEPKFADRVGKDVPAYDDVVNIFVDGSDEERSNAIKRIQTDETIDRHALGQRLRSEIEERFSPSHEEEFASAARDPKKFASIRSWMLSALVWADDENEANEELFLKHVNSSYEPDRNVRFWVLAGLWQRHVRVLHEAVRETAEDAMPEVRALSYAAGLEDSADAFKRFRPMLLSKEFEEAWSVLRVLRIIPVKDLVPELCQVITTAESGSNLLYDALYAASNPLMATDIAEELQKSLGIEGTVRIVMTAASSANRNASRNFAVLLAQFEADGGEDSVEDALESYIDDPITRPTAETLLEFVRPLRRKDEQEEIYIAGYASDFIDEKTHLDDSLGIEEDVKTLTAVMLAQDVQAPLAIGLFGDWGSGKSYFMQSMYASVEDLRVNGAPELFRKDVCQIRFNAWHYVDTNLWASLVSTILERLAAHVSPEDTPERKEAALIKELGTAKAIKDEAEAEKKGAQDQVTKKQGELQDLQIQREQKEIALTDLRIADLAVLLDREPELKKELEKSLEDLGVPAAIGSATDLSNVLVETNTLRSRAIAFALSIVHGRNLWRILGALLLMVIIIPFFGSKVITWFSANEIVVKGAELLGQATVAIASLTVVLRSAVSKLKAGLERVEQAKLAIDKKIAEERQTPSDDETKLQKEIAELKAREHEASSHLDAAAAKVVELEEQIRAINEGRSLARFLAERTNSEDYRKHLGLISTIRKDFDSLAKTLSKPAKTEKGERLAVDRIILYIDDLDRCPENKVMDVLQAVHLLLAYPLFVVVVGVDPRWLLHSLGTTYSAFQANDNTNAGRWRTTPQNYLEKIFQIPFNLNRMTGPGYGKLLNTLMGGAPPKKEVSVEQPSSGLGDTIGTPTDSEARILVPQYMQTTGDELATAATSTPRDGGQESLADKERADERAAAKGGLRGKTNGKKDQFVVRKEALVIQPWERAFAEKLYQLIPTPRATKRFSNIYRILKARIRREDLEHFEGTKEDPGSFQIPMLLLAMLIGSPEVCSKLFPIMLEQSQRNVGFAQIIEPLTAAPSNADINLLYSKIKAVTNGRQFPNTPSVHVYWIPRVARFSFDVGRAVQTT